MTEGDAKQALGGPEAQGGAREALEAERAAENCLET